MLTCRSIFATGVVLVAILAAAPVQAQTVKVGALTCNAAGGSGFIFGSTKDIRCKFSSMSGKSEYYHGAISKFGVDLGFTGKTTIVWAVFAPSASIPGGALAGNYGGVSAEATVGLGVGANALVGGSKNSIALQPLSVQGQQGLNVALGVSELSLRPGR